MIINRNARQTLLAGCALCALLATVAPQSSAAQAVSTFDIPSEDLGAALRAFASQSGRDVVFDPALVRNKTAPAVAGSANPEEALRHMLAGSGLHFTVTGSGSFVIQSPPKNAEAASEEGADNDPPTTVETVTVTGSNIPGVQNATIPVLVFDQSTILNSGYSSTEDFIRSLPQNFKGGPSGATPDANTDGQTFNNEQAGSGANLRGLGNNSTLVLLDGHRLAPSGSTQFVDLSMLPLNAIDHISVLTDGASAIYGSDAVGGVIDFTLKSDFDGAQSDIREDIPTQGGGLQTTLGQTFGRSWDGGDALLAVQYQDMGRVGVQQRSFTDQVRTPNDIIPSSLSYSAVFTGHEDPIAGVSLFADVLYNHKDISLDNSRRSQEHFVNSADQFVSATGGLRWNPFGDWQIEGSGMFGEDSLLIHDHYVPASPYGSDVTVVSDLSEGDLKVDGTVLSLPAGPVKIAVGLNYRTENDHEQTLDPPSPIFTQKVTDVAEYAELYIPIVGSSNALPLIERLEISAAVRHDHYDPYGDTTDPKIGFYWQPVADVGLRVSDGTSFRIPSASENAPSPYFFADDSFAAPGGGNATVIDYPNSGLVPEKSHNLSAGIDYQPSAVPGLRLSLNYYSLSYTNRIINAPTPVSLLLQPAVYGTLITHLDSPAAVTAFTSKLLSEGYVFYDLTSGQTGLANVQYAIPYGEVNAATVHTDGFDIGIDYATEIYGQNVKFGFASTYIDKIDTAYCPTCTATNTANTYGQPTKFRARGTVDWSDKNYSLNVAVNYTNGYTDTNIVPFGTIGDYTTVDLVARYRPDFMPGMSIGLSLINIFDVNPPRTSANSTGVTYDTANANPLGRVIGLQLAQDW